METTNFYRTHLGARSASAWTLGLGGGLRAAGKTSITPKTARLGSLKSLKKTNRRMIDPRCAEISARRML
jgi:hypothetical protein